MSELRDHLAVTLRTTINRQIGGEWICCNPVNPEHDLCVHGHSARKVLVPVLADDPGYPPSRIVMDAVMAQVEDLRKALIEAKLAHINNDQRHRDAMTDQLRRQRQVYNAWWSARIRAANAQQCAVRAIQFMTTAGKRARAAESIVNKIKVLHHPIEWVSLSDVCHTHHHLRTVEPCAENIAVADACPDCHPRRYMDCVCAEDPCAVLAALEDA